MNYSIRYTQQSLDDLQEIADALSRYVSQASVQKTFQELFRRAKILTTFPNSGQRETLLDFPEEYRYLVIQSK